jgi:hypothetical protein
MENAEKCEVAFARLKITVPDDYTIEKYQKQTISVLLYPGHVIRRETDKTYTVEDEAGNKIPNVDIETIVICGNEEHTLNIDYVRLEGMPKHIVIGEIVYIKPSTGEKKKITIRQEQQPQE